MNTTLQHHYVVNVSSTTKLRKDIAQVTKKTQSPHSKPRNNCAHVGAQGLPIAVP